ncbi:MAG: hypothetical protein C0422_09795 [Alcaligenaceae bacterium]|nr:hypothetical protein [Alcaligenaceae bacterium]
MNTWTPLRTLSDSELAAKANTELDTLTSTDLERELLQRFEEQLAWQPIFDLIKNTYANKAESAFEELPQVLEQVAALECVGELKEIVGALQDHNIDEVKALREKLERADKFYDVAQEAGEAFSMLAKLAETSQ